MWNYRAFLKKNVRNGAKAYFLHFFGPAQFRDPTAQADLKFEITDPRKKEPVFSSLVSASQVRIS